MIIKVSEDSDLDRPWGQGRGQFQERSVGGRWSDRRKEVTQDGLVHLQVHTGPRRLSWPGQG